MTLDEAYTAAEPLTVTRQDDGSLFRQNAEWPKHVAFDCSVLEWTEPSVLALEGHITMTLANGTATYRILGARYGGLVCELEDAIGSRPKPPTIIDGEPVLTPKKEQGQ